MSDCPNGDFRDVLPDLLHGRLAPAERSEVEDHLRDCALCREELELLREMSGSLRRAPAVNVGAIVAALPAYRAPARRVRSDWRIAAAIALLAAGGTSVAIARHRADAPAPVASATPGSVAPSPTRRGAPAPVPGEARELAVASSAIGDLDDGELSALLQDIESLDAVTPVEVEQGAVSPIAPAAPGAGA